MKTTANPLPTEAMLNDRQIIESAAGLLGLPFGTFSCEHWSSNKICTILITPDLLSGLSRQGIKKFNCKGGNGFSIIDTESTGGAPGFAPSNSWGFDQQRPHEFSFYVTFRISQRERAIQGVPHFMGNASGAADDQPNMRLLKLLLEIVPDALSSTPQKTLLKLLDENHVLTHFGELGLGGLRQMPELFSEWTSGNAQIDKLARSDHALFSLDPVNSRMFVKEQFQGQLFRTWKSELDDFKSNLRAA